VNFSILNKILSIPAILIAFTIHEYAHALIAYKLGDSTPKFQGRLSLNPLVHIDIFGFLFILVAGIGWAKPVETNPSSYKNYYKDDLKVSIAGPLSNLITAFAFAMIYRIVGVLGFKFYMIGTMGFVIDSIIQYIIYYNIMIAIFNIIPLPGLDGFHVLRDLKPSLFYKISDTIYRYQFIILMLFIISPLSSYIIGIPTKFIASLFLGTF
jgi:Zn-dependent protease